MRLLSLLLVLLVAAGCDSGNDQTYPPASNFPEVSLSTLLGAAPGQYNTVAFVTETSVCEVTPVCIGDTIELAESNDGGPTTTATLFVEGADQFEVDAPYRFSVRVSAQPRGPEPTGSVITLLGYDRLQVAPR